MLGRNRDAHVHVVYHQMSLHDLAFLLFRQRVEDRTQLTPYASEDRFAPSFWARIRHGTCSPTWSGLGFDKRLTFDPPSLVIKPLVEDHTPVTVKPFQVALVEPVAYQFQLERAAESQKR